MFLFNSFDFFYFIELFIFLVKFCFPQNDTASRTSRIRQNYIVAGTYGEEGQGSQGVFCLFLLSCYSNIKFLMCSIIFAFNEPSKEFY